MAGLGREKGGGEGRGQCANGGNLLHFVEVTGVEGGIAFESMRW